MHVQPTLRAIRRLTPCVFVRKEQLGHFVLKISANVQLSHVKMAQPAPKEHLVSLCALAPKDGQAPTVLFRMTHAWIIPALMEQHVMRQALQHSSAPVPLGILD